MNKPLIGLMLGDMTGIGPEILARLLAPGKLAEVARVVVIGDARVLELGMRDAGVRLGYRTYASVDEVRWPADELPVVDLGNIDPSLIKRGEVSAESGRLTGETLKYIIDLALSRKIDGICFAPLNKMALHRGGWPFPDEHQMFAKLTRHTGVFGEMNVIPEFATFRVTSHVALRKAIDLISPQRIADVVQLAHRTLRAMGHLSPRIAVAALNPHGGENGLFGDEEIRIIRPAVDALRASGVGVTGPVPADTLFLRAKRGEFDGVVMMYHDQGQIATKLLGFNKGVTVTAGMDTVFATPAHGTAFDIVGQGRANCSALEYAFRLAAQLASRKAET
ncbi:MAG: 4-hydroxythreonine-4-phosphate dehydrogenase PdxA [Betaproteobacteria bacterium]|nr:4-hydroxythreonine-4-phosphate dehydrogenase PdxA [Betaproteobacteria bacterium]MDH3438295.1 4-hydroxythreonine-4-phosphate dehydrogenase PdxA [Betaproteobacteria bacterium]